MNLHQEVHVHVHVHYTCSMNALPFRRVYNYSFKLNCALTEMNQDVLLRIF